MYQQLRVAVVIPAFNEERAIARVVAEVPGYVDHVIVVDDASGDGTAAAARASSTTSTAASAARSSPATAARWRWASTRSR